jgi:hypothetical protein
VDGTAFAAEDFDPHPDVIGATIFTGRFCVHWESDDGQNFRPGLDHVSVDEAITWGRKQADVVMVRVGDTYYSAGSIDPEDGSLPRWSEGRQVGVRFGWFVPPT